jgi:mxaJ protein
LLKKLKIGVQIIGDDGANSPPVHALNRRGIVKNLIGFPVYGDYSKPNPAMHILDALVAKQIDVAIVWGPFAGYFAKKAPVAINEVQPQIDLPYMPFVFDISMGVRRGDEKFREELDELIVRRHREIEKILDDFGVPRVS